MCLKSEKYCLRGLLPGHSEAGAQNRWARLLYPATDTSVSARYIQPEWAMIHKEPKSLVRPAERSMRQPHRRCFIDDYSPTVPIICASTDELRHTQEKIR